MNRRLLALVAVLVSACSEPPAGRDGLALSDFCTATADATCRAEVACGAVPETGISACIRVEASRCDVDRLFALVASGRVTYDGAAYRRCLDRFAATPVCDDGRNPVFPADDPDCIQAARGRVAPGESCGQGQGLLFTRECADGECSSFGCDGRCRTLSKLGDSCTTRPCGAGLHCLDETCRPLAGAGEACRQYGRDCAFGLFCRTEGDEPEGTCTAPLALGVACERPGDVCVAGAHCAERQPATCVPWGDEGASCAEVPDSCRAGFRCLSGTCVPQEPPGATCGSDRDCLHPATCHPETRVCILRPVVGEPCSAAAWPDGGCATGWCDGSTCRPMIPPGEACTQDGQCSGPEVTCRDGRCVPWGSGC